MKRTTTTFPITLKTLAIDEPIITYGNDEIEERLAQLERAKAESVAPQTIETNEEQTN